MLTVKEMLEFDIFRNFKVVAGRSGLNKEIKSTGILDFEFTKDIKLGEELFNEESLILSSLLFAKDDEQLLQLAIEQLIKYNISCLAYKDVFYTLLPDNVIELANKHGLVILKFQPDDAFFEDIIFEVRQRLKKERKAEMAKELIDALIDKNLTPEEAVKMLRSTNSHIRDIIQVASFDIDNSEKAYNLSRKFIPNINIKDKCIVANYRKELIAILSYNKKVDVVDLYLNDIADSCGFKVDEYYCGISNIFTRQEHIKEAVEDARIAMRVATLKNEKLCKYENTGNYPILLDIADNRQVKKYFQKEMSKIKSIDTSDEEILGTLIAYVKHKGNLEDTAESMFLHKNTVRYRINKVAAALGFSRADNEFYENIATIIKIHIIKEK